MTAKEIKQGVLDGSIPYGLYDSEATSSCDRKEDPFIDTGERSHNVFHIPTEDVAPSTEKTLL